MDISEKIYEIANAVSNAGGRAMLVGGCVRDRIAGKAVKDYDIEVYGLAPEKLQNVLSKVCQFDAVGASFGVLKVKHFNIDIALPRRENKQGRGHRGFLVEFDPAMDFASAAARRDFTVNAMMCDILSGEIIDPWHGQQDLKQGILRHVSPAFTEDPLRVLRAMQFIARFDLTPAPETVALCATLDQSELPPERLAAEWEKLLLQGVKISRGLEFLRSCGWVDFYPELAALIDCPQNPQWHPEGDVWNHTVKAVDAAAMMRDGSPDDLIFMLAVLCHDFGKPACTITDENGKITSCGHDTVTLPAEKFITSIWQRKDLPEKVLPLISGHMHPWQLVEGNASDKAYRKLALRVGRSDLLAKVAEADVRGVAYSDDQLAGQLRNIAAFRERCAALAIADSVPKPLILGRHLIDRGMKPGSGFKPLLDRCFDAQLAGEFSTYDEAMRFLDGLLCGK